jgi:hypothetical protein
MTLDEESTSPNNRGYETDDKLIPQDNIPLLGSEDGDNSLSQGIRNEPESNTQFGTGESEGFDFDTISDGDSVLNVEIVKDRFKERTKNRLKLETQKEYFWKFDQFVRSSDFKQLTRKQLAGTKGKELILKFLENEKPRTRRFSNAKLKSIWIYGLDLPYPIDTRKDLGKLPKIGRRGSPQDSVVQQWAQAVRREEDPYLRLIVLAIMQHGWRPSHVCKLKQRNLRYDATGKPIAIIANGSEEDFKTSSPIIAALAEDMATALVEVRKMNPETLPERPLIPFRSVNGEIVANKEQEHHALRLQWKRFQEKHLLPTLRPVDIRHWVATVCRKSDLSKVASAGLMGHDPFYGGSMRDWYDSPQDEDILREQREVLPDGPIGFLFPRIEISAGIPEEAMTIVSEYLSGMIGTMDFVNQMESLKVRQSEKPVTTVQV